MTLRRYIFPLLLAVLIPSCTPARVESESAISTSREYVIASKQEIYLKDAFIQEEDRYLVFFHSETCTHCQQIMGDVVAFAELNVTKTYFINTSKKENNVRRCAAEELIVGVDSIEDLAIVGTPTIIEVEDGRTTANVPGKELCLTFLNEQVKTYKK